MNRLKYIFRVNVPHRVSSSVNQPRCGHYNGSCFKRRHSKLRLSKSNKFLPSAKETVTKNYNPSGAQHKEKYPHKCSASADIKNIQTRRQKRSAEPTTCIDSNKERDILCNNPVSTCSYSTHEPAISNNVIREKRCDKKYENVGEYNDFNERHQKPKTCESDCDLAQKQTEVRTYAQMIADYSELAYFKKSETRPRMYLIEQNSFEGSRKVSTKDGKTEGSETPVYSVSLHRDSRPVRSSSGSFGQFVRFNSGGPSNQFDRIEDNDFQMTKVLSNPAICSASASEGKEDRSYAKMISDYSAALYTHASSYITSVKTAAGSELSRLNSLESVLLRSDGKSSPDNSTNKNVAMEASEFTSHLPNAGNYNFKQENQFGEPGGWECETESKKSVSLNNSANFEDPRKMSVVHLLNNIGAQKWLDRTVIDHKLETIPIDPTDPLKHSKNVNVQNFVRSHDASCTELKDKNPNTLNLASQGSQPAAASTLKKPPQVPTSTSAGTRPQVELQMAASASGTVVSINVDRVKALNHLNAESNELSVVVRSNKSDAAAPHSNRQQLRSSSLQDSGSAFGQKTNHGPVRFTIAEESAPVKQIEFSINGRPASEVKSITALAEKLDVVSSIDALEVRVPFPQNSATSGVANKSTAKAIHASAPVLNIQISAKFDQPLADHSTDTIARTTAKDEPKPKPPGTPRTHYVLRTPTVTEDKKNKTTTGPVAPIKDSSKGGGGKSGSGNSAPVGLSGQVSGTKASQGIFKAGGNDVLAESRGRNIVDVDRDRVCSSAEVVGRGNVARKGGGNENMNIDGNEESADLRTPSRMIPRWSSDDAFRNIRSMNNNRETPNIKNQRDSFEQRIGAKKVETSESTALEQEKSANPAMERKNKTSETGAEVKESGAFKAERERVSQRQDNKLTARYPGIVRTESKVVQDSAAVRSIKRELRKNGPGNVESKGIQSGSPGKQRDQQKQDNTEIEGSNETGKKSQGHSNTTSKELKPIDVNAAKPKRIGKTSTSAHETRYLQNKVGTVKGTSLNRKNLKTKSEDSRRTKGPQTDQRDERIIHKLENESKEDIKVCSPTETAKKLDQNVIHTPLNVNTFDLENEANQKQVLSKTSKSISRESTKVNEQTAKVESAKENNAAKTVKRSSTESGTIQLADRVPTNKTTASEGSVRQKIFPSNQATVAQKISASGTNPLSEPKANNESDDSYAKLIRETKYTGKKNQLVSDASKVANVKKSAQATKLKQSSDTDNLTPKKTDSVNSENKSVASKGKQPKTVKRENVFDSMRPIEMRKDGTLIDFGVKVPSRKKPEKFKIRVKPIRDTTSFSRKLKEANAEKLKAFDKTTKDDVKAHVRTAFVNEQKETDKAAPFGKFKTNTLTQTDSKSATRDKEGEKKVAKSPSAGTPGKSEDGVTKPSKHDKDGKPSGNLKFATYAPEQDTSSASYKEYTSNVQHLRSMSTEKLIKPLLENNVTQRSLKESSATSMERMSDSKLPNTLNTRSTRAEVSSTSQKSENISGSFSQRKIASYPENQSKEKIQRSIERSSEFTPYEDFLLSSFTPFTDTIVNCHSIEDLPSRTGKSENFSLPRAVTQQRKRWRKECFEVKSANAVEVSKQGKTRLLNRIDTERSHLATGIHGSASDIEGDLSGIVNSSKRPQCLRVISRLTLAV